MTYEQALQSQWTIAQHRIAYAKENQKPCNCSDCREHLAAMATKGATDAGAGI